MKLSQNIVHIATRWSYIRSLNLANASTTASSTLWEKILRRNGCSLGHVTAFNILNPINTFLEWMKLHSLNLPIRSTMVSPNFRGKLIFPERAVVWVTWSFLVWSHALNLNFANASTMVIVPHQGLKIPRFHQKRVWCRSRDRCLNFNPFNISGGMWWGRWRKAGGGVRPTMLRRIPSPF